MMDLPSGLISYLAVEQVFDPEQGLLTKGLIVGEQRDPTDAGHPFDLDPGASGHRDVDILAGCANPFSGGPAATGNEADVSGCFGSFPGSEHIRIGDRFDERHTESVGIVDPLMTMVRNFAAAIFLHAELDHADSFIGDWKAAFDAQNAGTLKAGGNAAVQILLAGDVHLPHNV